MHRFANPARFNRLADRLLPWLVVSFVGALVYGLYQSLIVSPPDYQQGETVRIMYIHVPSAWMGLFTYVMIAVASFVSLVWRHPLADIAAKAAAPIGAAFTFLALVTGAMWGRPMWGAYWVWDARLTSVLVLFFLYIGYMAIWRSMDDQQKAAKIAAVLALVGVVNIPIIKFSVEWWNTLHQPASVMRMGGPTIDGSMLVPLFTMMAAFKLYFLVVLIWRMKTEINLRKVANLQHQRVTEK